MSAESILAFAALFALFYVLFYTAERFRPKGGRPEKPPIPFYGMPESWTHDCQGKQDLDFEILSASCRYYPSNYRADRRPSAVLSVRFGGETIIETKIAGDTESEVKSESEAWLRNVVNQISAAINNEVRA